MVPMYVGFANAVNSLYNVKKMVFDDVDNVATLETLTMALINNWGHKYVILTMSKVIAQGRGP